MTLRYSLASVLLTTLWLGSARVVFAEARQGPPSQGALADQWLNDAVRAQRRLDSFGRYVAAPLGGLLGGFMLVAPPFAELNPASTVLYMTGGALLLTAATGMWAASDPATAQRWFSRWASLGFVSAGIGLMISAASDDEGHTFARRATFAFAALEVGMFASLFLLNVLMQPESPAALQSSLSGADSEARHAAVLDFLKQRAGQQRVTSLVMAPWPIGIGVATMALSSEAASSGSRAFMLGLGIGVVALSAASLIYDLAHTPDWERFQAGESP